jgi:hypothetical protein
LCKEKQRLSCLRNWSSTYLLASLPHKNLSIKFCHLCFRIGAWTGRHPLLRAWGRSFELLLKVVDRWYCLFHFCQSCERRRWDWNRISWLVEFLTAPSQDPSRPAVLERALICPLPRWAKSAFFLCSKLGQ